MSTTTHTRGLRGILDDLPARGLPIPAPSRRPEEVVAATLEEMKRAHRKDRKKAEETIEEYGLTIEVARLRDRLARAATGDLQRLLLSTPGVPEKLFNEAIERQLKDEEEDDDKDDTLEALVDKLDELLEALKDRGQGNGRPEKPTPQKPEPQRSEPQKPEPQKPAPQKPAPQKPAPTAEAAATPAPPAKRAAAKKAVSS